MGGRTVTRHLGLPGDAGRVDATGAVRRLQALCAVGWSADEVAKLLGMPRAGSHIRTLERGRQATIYARTDRAIRALYDEISMKPGPSDVARQLAQQRGWAPPLAWDDDEDCTCEEVVGHCCCIDNPQARPAGVGTRRRLTFVEVYDELCALGYRGEEQIAERMGISVRSLRRQLSPSRHGLEIIAS